LKQSYAWMKHVFSFSIAALTLAPLPALAQAPATARLPHRPASHSAVLEIEKAAPALLRHAAVIFSGRVVAITHLAPEGAASSSIQITFIVEDAIRGVLKGDIFQLLEWPGRWQAGERYRIGERYLLFLHAANPAGLASPVGGSAGRFLIDGNGNIDISSLRHLSGTEAVGSIQVGPPPSSPIPLPRHGNTAARIPGPTQRVHTE